MLKRVSGVIPRKENPERFHEKRTWVEIPMLAAVYTVEAVTIVAKAVEDMAGPHRYGAT